MDKLEMYIIRIYNKEGMYLEDFATVEDHMGGGFCFDYTDNKEGARTFTKKELEHIDDVLIDEEYSILRYDKLTIEKRIKQLEEDMSIFDYVITTLVKETLSTEAQNQVVEMMSMMRKTFTEEKKKK